MYKPTGEWPQNTQTVPPDPRQVGQELDGKTGKTGHTETASLHQEIKEMNRLRRATLHTQDTDRLERPHCPVLSVGGQVGLAPSEKAHTRAQSQPGDSCKHAPGHTCPGCTRAEGDPEVSVPYQGQAGPQPPAVSGASHPMQNMPRHGFFKVHNHLNKTRSNFAPWRRSHGGRQPRAMTGRRGPAAVGRVFLWGAKEPPWPPTQCQALPQPR